MPLNIDFLQVLLHMLNFVILAGGLTFLLFKPISSSKTGKLILKSLSATMPKVPKRMRKQKPNTSKS